MNALLGEALSVLNGDAGRTIAIINGENTVTSCDRGVRFLLGLVESNDGILNGATVADKVVGRAAAFLMAKGGVKRLYAIVLSAPAAGVLKRYGIEYDCGELVDGIVNRRGNGRCPMESAVLGATDADEAVKILHDLVGRV